MTNVVQDYELLKQQAEEEHRRNLDAIERVRLMQERLAKSNATITPVSEGVSNGTSAKQRKTRGKSGAKHGAVLAAVRDAIESLNGKEGRFTFKDISEKIEADSPRLKAKRGTLRAVLKKIAEGGEIEMVTQGIGRNPTVYRKK